MTVHGLGPACILDATLLAVEACERYSPWLAAGTVTGTEAMVDEYTVRRFLPVPLHTRCRDPA